MPPLRRTAHAVYEAQYHLVWTPKYRKALLHGAVAQRLDPMLREIAQAYEIEIDEMEVATDHVHIFCSFPPKLAISRAVSILKSLSARGLFREFPHLRQELWGGQFWSDSFFARTVGDRVTAETVRRYIQGHRGHPGDSRPTDGSGPDGSGPDGSGPDGSGPDGNAALDPHPDPQLGLF
jgi:putative transposase